MTAADQSIYCERIVNYMLKAMREAKQFTSWINPSDEHERAMRHFIETVLAPDHAAFLDDFRAFQQRIAQLGIYNSLAQLALKVTAPGVPDFYQGTELWDFSLVDPDNRRPVDYETRGRLLTMIDCDIQRCGRTALVADLLANILDPRLKLFTTASLLRFRRSQPELFDHGAYRPIVVEGNRQAHIFAFSRGYAGRDAVIAVPRLLATLLPDPGMTPLGERVWGDTHLLLPSPTAAGYHNVLTDRCVPVQRDTHQVVVRAADLFAEFPIAVLEGR
jgi:(1->4)-alpha-D-glucan 1-alpha-D-glucosylmutase